MTGLGTDISRRAKKPTAEQDTTHAETEEPEHYSVSPGTPISVALTGTCGCRPATPPHTSAPEVGP